MNKILCKCYVRHYAADAGALYNFVIIILHFSNDIYDYDILVKGLLLDMCLYLLY